MKRIYWLWLACSLATVVGCGDSTPSGNPPPPTDTGKVPDAGDQDTGTPPEDRQTPPDVQNPPDTGEMPDVQNPPDTGKTPDVQTPDTGPTPCAMGEMRCGDMCVDVQSNNGNCGMCGNACSATQTCQMGTCRDPMMCPMGQSLCGTSCVNTQTDMMNCGSCGNACMTGQTCQAGVCQTAMMCPMGQTSCAGSCVDTQTDANNCGACGTVCPTGQSCQTGMCRATTMCMMGQTACGGTCVDTNTDANNCGACGTVCPTGQTCQTGMCRAMMCPMGQTLCGTACVDLNTDNANCGTCGRACAMGQTCQVMSGMANCVGTVMCPTGQTMCGTACADLQSDPANCGRCGNACMTGQECRAGTCTTPRPTCMMGQTDCAPMAMTPTCVDLQTSNANCGACGRACPTGQTCTAGVCTCATGQTLCGRACVNLMTDGMNCGACGTACPMGQTCMAGMCRCAMANQTICGGACVNTMTDNNNCGMCGRVCPMGQTCTAGACACPTGQTSCGTPPACVNTMTDRANCGRCGNACPTGQTCTAGTCACPMGQTACGTGSAATCVDLQTNAMNCGRCGMACATGTSCMGGMCRGMPPANDTRAGATVINLAMPAQTLSANTTAARNDTTSCRCTSGNDVFFRFTLTAPEVVYADTFGATWDTSLFLQNSTGMNLSGTLAAAPNVTCNDDTSMAGFCPTLTNLQSQIAARLPAGTYYLVLSGCGSGTADIHFQHLPAGNGNAARIAPSATEQTATGTTSGTGSVSSTCCSGGADNTHWWVTCPGTAAQTFYASTCNATTGANLVGYDVEIAQYSALRTTGAVCNDDIGGVCGNGASMTSTIPATSSTVGGLNTLIADSCTGAGAYTIRYSLSAPCATGSRCGTTCIDTNTNVNNCGACDRRCPTGNLCIAGACIAPPANDLPANAVTINMNNPQSTFTVDTRAAANNTSGTCGCTTGRDVFYNFTIPTGAPQIIYADTIGSNYDTSLFVQTSTGTNVTATGLPTNGIACNDDNGLSGCSTGLQSQILLQLNPGAYRLVVSGCGNGGTANLRFQHAPVGNGAVAFLAAGSSTPGGTVSGTGRVNLGCGGGGPENTYYWHTCASFTMARPFTASTCGRATWDTSLSQYSPGRTTPGANVCADDSCSLQSSVSSTIPVGPGLHMLYVDTFTGRTAGAYTVSVSRP